MHFSPQRTKSCKVLSELWKVYAIIIPVFFNPRLTTVMWEQAPLIPDRKLEGFVCADQCLPAICLMGQCQLPQLRALVWDHTSKVFDEKNLKTFWRCLELRPSRGYLTCSLMFNGTSSHLVLSDGGRLIWMWGFSSHRGIVPDELTPMFNFHLFL